MRLRKTDVDIDMRASSWCGNYMYHRASKPHGLLKRMCRELLYCVTDIEFYVLHESLKASIYRLVHCFFLALVFLFFFFFFFFDWDD
jgi:hypothetical protein